MSKLVELSLFNYHTIEQNIGLRDKHFFEIGWFFNSFDFIKKCEIRVDSGVFQIIKLVCANYV